MLVNVSVLPSTILLSHSFSYCLALDWIVGQSRVGAHVGCHCQEDLNYRLNYFHRGRQSNCDVNPLGMGDKLKSVTHALPRSVPIVSKNILSIWSFIHTCLLYPCHVWNVVACPPVEYNTNFTANLKNKNLNTKKKIGILENRTKNL